VKFNYQARTKNGEIRTGQIEASSEEAAISLLQSHGMYVTFLGGTTTPLYAKRIKFFESISKKEIVLFSRQLSIMFKSRVSLLEALRVIANQTRNSDFREKILKLSEEVEGGTPFSKALSLYPNLFSSFYIAMIKSGELSGKLSEVLDYLADHLEREYYLVSKTKGALIYPSMIVLVVVLVLVLMIFFVIPNLTQVFEATGQELPAVTKIVISTTNLLRSQGLWLLAILIALVIFYFRFSHTEKGKKFLDDRFIKLPLIGEVLKMIYVSRFAENLSTLISGGLPIAQALETVGEIIGNDLYQEVILEARDRVRRGEAISSVLSQFPDLFPPVVSQMVLVGERTGTLDVTLMNIVNFYQKEIDRSIDNLLSVMEPILIVFLGAIVGGLMLSILLPLYQTISL